MKIRIEKLYVHFSRGAKGSMGSPKAEDICKHNDDSDNKMMTMMMIIIKMMILRTLTRRNVATMAR